jgi:redox-sensitive bicupin YhaK (pirin superfamily)
MYLDFRLDSGAEVEQPVPQGWTVFAYILTGKAQFGTDVNCIIKA